MRYQKPIVMDLGGRARLAAGGPLACISGPAATGFESCGTGDGATWSCGTGNGVFFSFMLCVGGGAADDCFSGTDVAGWCGAGTLGGTDLYGCQAGPSFV